MLILTTSLIDKKSLLLVIYTNAYFDLGGRDLVNQSVLENTISMYVFIDLLFCWV